MTLDFWTVGFFILLAVLLGTLSFLPKFRRIARMSIAERTAFLRRTSDLILILDEELQVREVNRSVLVRFQAAEDDILGHGIEDTLLWPSNPGDKRMALQALRKALDGEQSLIQFGTDNARGYFGKFEVRVFPIPSRKRGFLNLVCYARDVSKEEGSRQRLKRRDEVENIIADISEAAFAEGDARKRVPEILEKAGRFLGARRAFLLQTDRDNTIAWEHFWADPGISEFSIKLKGLSMESIMPVKLLKGTAVLKNLTENEDIPFEFRKRAGLSGMHSLVLLTLATRDGRIFGYSGFSFDTTEPPDDSSASILFRLLLTTLTGLLSKVDARKNIEIFRQSVDAAGQGIAIINEEGLLLYANRTYRVISGHSQDSREPVWSAYDGSFGEKVKALILPLVRSGERWTGELGIIGPKGNRIDTIESFFPVDTDIDDTRYVINIITDISDRKRLESQLIKARKEAEMANRAKSDYLANMSHEIRTPMNAVIGLAFLALQTELDGRQRDYLTKINTAAKGLLNIINDILDLSKIEAGRLDLEIAPFSLDEVLENIAALTMEKAWEKGLKLYIRRPPGISDAWMGDPYRLGQVLLNLIGNAIKFTEKGHISVNVINDVAGQLRFTVEDTGIGMTEIQREKLFTPFQQAEVSTSRKFGGTGLGLTISKQIVELMKGSIEVQSLPGKGSRFAFTATLDRPQNVTGKSSRDYTLREAEGRTAFIVCGNPESMDYHVSSLEALGYSTIRCPRLKEALENPAPAAVVLLDVDDCDKNPVTAAYALSNETHEDFRLILSGSMDATALSEYSPDGVKHSEIPIPYAIRKLRSLLDGSAPQSKEQPSTTRSAGGASTNRRILLADDNEINRQVGRELLEAAGLSVETAINGKEAVEACRNGTFDLVFMDLHMPEMDGYEATVLLRKTQSDIPIIAMTASSLNDVKSEILDVGFSGYIAKPIDPDQLFSTVSETLAIPARVFRTAVAVNRHEKNNRKEEIRIEGIDTRLALHQVLGHKEKFRHLLEAFAETHRADLVKLQALDELDDIESVVFILHSLRGAAGHIGASALKEAAGTLEETLRHKPDDTWRGNLARFTDSLEHLIVDIESALSPKNGSGTDDFTDFFDNLEDMLRRSDGEAQRFIEKNTFRFKRQRDRARVENIRAALARWNYDAALDSLDDWRMDIGSRGGSDV